MAEKLTLLDRLLGRRGDIELPAESGKKDPRLEKVDVLGQLKKAYGAAKDIASEKDSLEGLKKAGKRKQ